MKKKKINRDKNVTEETDNGGDVTELELVITSVSANAKENKIN